MRITVVAAIFKPEIGGPSTFLDDLITYLLNYKYFEIVVITLAKKDSEDTPSKGLKIIKVKRKTNKLIRFIKLTSLIRLYGNKSDLVFSNGLLLESVIATKLFNRKTLYAKFVGDLIYEKFTNEKYPISHADYLSAKLPLNYRILNYVQTAYLRRVDRLVTPSKYMRTFLLSKKIPTNICSVINNGSIQPKNLKNSSTKVYDFVFIGRLIKLKQVNSIIKAVNFLGKNLLVIGGGPEEMNLRRLNTRNDQNIEFAGPLSSKETAEKLRTCRAIILYSVHETFPHVLLEAMFAKVIVIASNVGGIPEIIPSNEYGYLVDPSNYESLVDAMYQSYTDVNNNTNIINKAYDRAIDLFGKNKEMEKWRNILIKR